MWTKESMGLEKMNKQKNILKRKKKVNRKKKVRRKNKKRIMRHL